MALTRRTRKQLVRMCTRYLPCEVIVLRRWAAIASTLPGRTGKQVRERWVNQLDPSIKRTDWTNDEVIILMQAHSELGSAWKEISKRLPGPSAVLRQGS